MIYAIRSSLRMLLGLPLQHKPWQGQPFQLDMLECLAQQVHDPDCDVLQYLENGVPLGVTEELRAPAGIMVEKSEDSDIEEGWPDMTPAQNYPSAEAFQQQLRANFMDDVREGLAIGPFQTVEETAKVCCCLPSELVFGALAANEENDK
eukprot:3083576-Amphidinium_carterae.1